jgi:diguanylate cyclase (GGDEF)-like protein
MVGENKPGEYVTKLLNEIAQLKEEREQLKKHIRELETEGKWVKYPASEYFNVRVGEEVAKASRYKYEFSIILGELDNLDIYTRRNGKDAAEEILSMFEIVIQDSLRNTDLKCDFGKGRFGALLPYTDCDGARVAAEKIRAAVEHIFALKSQTTNIKLTISIGLAGYPADAVYAENLLVQAREAYALARIEGNSICAASAKGKMPGVEVAPEINLIKNDSFLHALDDEIARSSRYSLKFTLMVLAVTDLETGKKNLDGSVRAAIMRTVFKKLNGNIRTIDRAYLYTDTRFALVLPGTGAEGCAVLANNLIHSITAAPVVQAVGKDTAVTINIGISAYPADDVSRDGLLRKVEAALNHATGKGYNHYSLAADALSYQGQGQRDVNEWIAMLKDGGQAAVFNLLSVIDMTERYEPPHSQAVAGHAMATGKVMGLTSTVLKRLRVTAMLHDLGKICIAPAIITRPGPLRDDEWETMMSHPQYGAAILEQLPDFAYCCIPVLSHHEMWNGKGYPHGIKGENIPLESRIIAVAEAFDDMVSPRPYRSLVLPDDAMRELREKAGTQFDPAVVEAFLKTLPGPKGK